MIVSHSPQRASRAATATAFMFGGEFVEPGPTTRVLTNRKDQRVEREVTRRVSWQ